MRTKFMASFRWSFAKYGDKSWNGGPFANQLYLSESLGEEVECIVWIDNLFVFFPLGFPQSPDLLNSISRRVGRDKAKLRAPPLSLSRSLASTLSLSSKSSENNGKSNSAAEANETGKKVFCAESEGARERGAGHCNRKGGAKRWTWLRRRSRSPSHNQPCSRRLTWVRPLKAGSALVLLRMCLQLKPFCNNLFLGD